MDVEKQPRQDTLESEATFVSGTVDGGELKEKNVRVVVRQEDTSSA